MNLLLQRIAVRSHYTIGRLYIDNAFFCHTLEPRAIDWTRENKIWGKTAIPAGRYPIALNVVSPRYSNPRYRWAAPYGGRLPRLLNVPHFEGILLHVGNSSSDTRGCILVGKNTIVGRLTESTRTFHKLMARLRAATGKDIQIEVKDCPNSPPDTRHYPSTTTQKPPSKEKKVKTPNSLS